MKKIHEIQALSTKKLTKLVPLDTGKMGSVKLCPCHAKAINDEKVLQLFKGHEQAVDGGTTPQLFECYTKSIHGDTTPQPCGCHTKSAHDDKTPQLCECHEKARNGEEKLHAHHGHTKSESNEKKPQHCHKYSNEHPTNCAESCASIVTIRAQSGISGDMLLAGFASLLDVSAKKLDEYVAALNLPVLQKGTVLPVSRSINGIGGLGVEVVVPHEHAHRTCTDIEGIINESSMSVQAKKLAHKTFRLLAEAEGAVHGMPASEVTFHEVGGLDSIVDICLVAALVTDLVPSKIVCSPLPLADGHIRCAHGLITSPAPAVVQMLQGVAVCAFDGQGETVTPTALALLKSMGVEFGKWPSMVVSRSTLVYGSKVFENVPNGAIFALGNRLSC